MNSRGTELLVASALCAAVSGVTAETMQLTDKVSITGKILEEKHDLVIVDIGYTVLEIPRNQIIKISKGDSATPTNAAPACTLRGRFAPGVSIPLSALSSR